MAASKRKKNGSVNLLPAFEITFVLFETINKTAAKLATYTSVIEMVIHFWRQGVLLGELAGHVDGERYREITTNHLWWSNAIKHILRVSPEEQIFSVWRDSSGKKMMLSAAQNSVEWTMDLLFNFRMAGELVVDTCPGTWTTAKACLQLPEHRRFVGFEKDSTCF